MFSPKKLEESKKKKTSFKPGVIEVGDNWPQSDQKLYIKMIKYSQKND